jgi:hypothetical protein
MEMSRRLLSVLWLLNAAAMACQNRDEGVKPVPESRPVEPSSISPAPAAAVSENIDELARFVQLPVRPAAASWQYRRMGSNDHPDVPGPSDFFLVAVLRYAPADADRLVAAHSTSPASTDTALADWFPPDLRALAHSNADGLLVLSGTRYGASYVRSPFSVGALTRIGASGWFVLALWTS